jgi:hypothetical protein
MARLSGGFALIPVALGLAPDEFAWFRGETRQPMPAQRVVPDKPYEVDYFTSAATYYGGRIANGLGNFVCGHIHAYVSEAIPEGAKYQADPYTFPAPYIPRLLTVKKDLITVDTPTLNPSLSDGPVVVEGQGRSPRYRKTTVYNTETGDVTVKSGRSVNGHGWSDDRTIEQDAFELPDDMLLLRLATVIRTIRATSSMFDQIAWRNARNVSWSIQEEPPK